MAKFVRYGPPDRYGMPEAGFCASAFAIVRSGRKVLLGIPKRHPRWEAEWAPNFSVYAAEDLASEFRLWRFPAALRYQGGGVATTKLATLVRDRRDRRAEPGLSLTGDSVALVVISRVP